MTESHEPTTLAKTWAARDATELYAHRFSESDQRRREAAWGVLCRDFFQRYVPSGGTVVDVGAGDGLFLRHIEAGRRIAVDASDRAEELTQWGIEVRLAPAHQFADGLEGVSDVVFLSNLLEHLPQKHLVVDVLRECRRVLRPGGQLLILQPNIRYVGAAYWDYLDHQIALTERSVAEALGIAGFEIVEEYARFLPYTATSFRAISPKWLALLMRIYLRVPPLWLLFGGQCFFVARAAR